MSKSDIECHPDLFSPDATDDPAVLGQRWAAALKRRYDGRNARKRIARDFEVAPRTAESWLCGQVPMVRHMSRAAGLFGMVIIAEILAPDSRWHRELLVTDRIGTLNRQIDDILNDIAALRHENGRREDGG